MERLEQGRTRVVFHSKSGPLPVGREGKGYVMDFPARPSEPIAAPAGLDEALGATPVEVLGNEFNYMAVLESEQCVRALTPDMAAVARLGRPGIIVTAAGEALTIS
jgi:predicted PhzF superfamily epimerase YddE/YHI9